MDNKYINEKIVKKTFNVCAILQCLYYLGCIAVMICMPFCTVFYPSVLSEICVYIGAILTAASTFNPIGLLCFICMLITYCIDNYLIKDKKTRIKMIVWLVISPLLHIVCWILAVVSFVHHTGGV